MAARRLRAAVSRVAEGYRSAVVRGRWVVLGAWVLLGVLVFTVLPTGADQAAVDQGFSNLLPAGSPALAVEERSLAQFRVPVLSGTTVVLHGTDGIDLRTRALSAKTAYLATRQTIESGPSTRPGRILAAIPVPLVSPDTVVTYLFLSPGTSIWRTVTLAHHYAARLTSSGQHGLTATVTGFVPAQVAQAEHLAAALPLFELASLLVIAGIVTVTFRSVLAPVAVLVVGGAGFLIFSRVLAALASVAGLSVPQQLEPVLAALFIGVITDYCVLLFSAFRDAIADGDDRFDGARTALRLDAPVVAVAGITVAGGITALLVSPFQFFQALGPALAITVLAAVIVSLTLTPALMTLIGARLFALRGAPVLRRARQSHDDRAHPLLRLLIRRGPAAAVTLVLVTAFALCAAPALGARLSLSFTAGLPSDDPVSVGAAQLSAAGIRGITAPVEVLAEGPGVTRKRAALDRVQAAIERAPGVVRVIGPAQNPFGTKLGVVLAASGNAARWIVILDSDPLGARAVQEARGLQSALPRIFERSGLTAAVPEMTGQTLVASEVARLTLVSLRDTLLCALAIELLILIVYLRSLLAPLLVLLSGFLSMGAALGLTVLLFQDRLGQPGLTFYAPFSTAVLLLALGADYTVFTVGSIWREARTRPLRPAIVAAVPASARAVTAAGVILASTFALLALVPLTAFRQIAFTMTVGLLLDTMLVRPVLTPALLSLLGRAARWPARAPDDRRRPPSESAQPVLTEHRAPAEGASIPDR